MRVKVRSQSGRGTYDVTSRGVAGAAPAFFAYACTCPRYGFSQAPKTCKHCTWLRTAEQLVARCHKAHGTPGGGVCLTCLVEIVGRALTRRAPKTRR